MRHYDYVIVGGGSAGCVLAYRLSADPRNQVLLIEAGPEDRSPFIHMPMGAGKAISDPRYAWYYPAEPERATGDKPGVWVRGKVLGGSSSINGMVYGHGDPSDYDGWKNAGACDWGWAEIRQAFAEMEDHELGEGGDRGTGGPLHVSIQPYRTPVNRAVLEGIRSLGTPVKDDVNEGDREGAGYTPMTAAKGRRVSSASAFLAPARSRNNLEVVTDTSIGRVLIENGRAVGVSGFAEGRPVEYRGREVILSSGVIGSPKILQLSGVGPADLLRSLGIDVFVDLPGVGQNLSEHKGVWAEYRLKVPYSLNTQMRGWRLVKNALRYQLFRTGPLASTQDISGFIRTRPGLPAPDVQLCIWSMITKKDSAKLELEPFPGITFGAWQVKPASRGTTMIRSSDPADMPVITPNFLEKEGDRETLVAAFRYLRALAATPALAPLIAEEVMPGPSISTDEEIVTSSYSGQNGYHATGTCSMGNGPEGVVDGSFWVRGCEGLRVVDCSVMPTQVTSGTAGPVLALAWHAAGIILADKRS